MDCQFLTRSESTTHICLASVSRDGRYVPLRPVRLRKTARCGGARGQCPGHNLVQNVGRSFAHVGVVGPRSVRKPSLL
jgi:hypothetical protein